MRIFLGKLCDLDGGAACTNDDDGDEDNGVDAAEWVGRARASERARASYAKMRTQKPVATSGRQSRGRRRRREGPVSDDAGMHARRPTDRRHLAPRARDETGWRRRRRWGERMSGDPLRGEGSARDPKEEERGGGERERPHRRSVAGPFPALAGLPPPGLLLGRLLPPPFARRRRRRRGVFVRPSVRSLIERAKVQGGNCPACCDYGCLAVTYGRRAEGEEGERAAGKRVS